MRLGTENICGALVWKLLFIKIILQVAFRRNSKISQSYALYLPIWSGLVSIYLQIFPLKTIYFTKKWLLTEHTLNSLNTFFTLMRCPGKWQVFTSWITVSSICFMQKCAWHVFVLKKNHSKIKNTGCIHVFSCNIIEISNC